MDMLTPDQRFNQAATEINAQLNSLSMTYDAKVLSAMLLTRASHILRQLHDAGIYKPQDIMKMVDYAFADVLTPLPAEQKPKVVTIGGPEGGKVN